MILALANNKITGPIIKGAGSDFANLGYDMSNIFGLGNIYDSGLNLFGINRKKDDPEPPVIIQQPVVNPTSDPTSVPINTGGTGGGGGADASQPDFPIIGGNQGGGGNVVVGSSFTPPSTNVQQETDRIRDILDRRDKGSSQGFNMGGLATVARYLKGR